MRVHLTSTTVARPLDSNNFASGWLKESAAHDPFGRHQLTADPEQADIILFVEAHPPWDPFVLGIRKQPLFRRYPSKTFLYQDGDQALPFIRGIYPSIRKRDYQPDRCRSGGYIARVSTNEFVRHDPEPVEREWLYSFFGEANSVVRAAIFSMRHPLGWVRDTTGRRHWELPGGSPERRAFTSEFADSIRRSQFILCPAGVGPSTYRLYEAMEMGRAPVILSDDWVPVKGPRWEDFSLRLSDRQLPQLEAILAANSSRHEEMGRCARAAWEQHFSQEVSFHRLTELCAELLAEKSPRVSSFQPWRRLLTSSNAKIWLRPKYQGLKERLRLSHRAGADQE